MYVFSVNATARNNQSGVPEGSQVPFMVYVNFADRFGAEQLCKVYLLRAGFKDVQIEQCKSLSAQSLQDERLLRADPAIQEALQWSYKIRMFEAGVH